MNEKPKFLEMLSPLLDSIGPCPVGSKYTLKVEIEMTEDGFVISQGPQMILDDVMAFSLPYAVDDKTLKKLTAATE